MITDRNENLDEQGSVGRPTVSFRDFATWLSERLGQEERQGFEGVDARDLFSWAMGAGVTEEDLTRWLSEYCGVPCVAQVDREEVDRRVLSQRFCEAKLVVAVRSSGSRQTVVLSNPFDWELFEDLERTIPRQKELAILLASPRALRAVLGLGPPEAPSEDVPLPLPRESPPETPRTRRREDRAYDPEKDPDKGHPLAQLAMALLTRAVSESASHLLVEPRGPDVVAKAKVGGRTHDFQNLPLETGRMLVARFKALAGLDVAKKRTPQTGSLDVWLEGEVVKLRISTAPTAAFESLTIRVLNPAKEALPLGELGLSTGQVKTLVELARMGEGLILFVGPPGSGKSTTIYSLLTAVADERRIVVSVEDPIEHKIPFARQNEVRDDPDGSFRSLVQRAMGDRPDVLFPGEIRGLTSAQACVEFSNAGHLTLSSMTSSNAATAIFRLERLGVSRSDLGDALIGVVAQRALEKLCPHCKEVRQISPEEAELLKPFTAALPENVAHPVGCSDCGGTGYLGQEGVFEVIPTGPRMSELIRGGHPIAEIRDYAEARGDLLIGDHAIRKIRNLVFPVEDVYRSVLLEENPVLLDEHRIPIGEDATVPAFRMTFYPDDDMDVPPMLQSCVLVVEDEEGTLLLLENILSKAGYRVVSATDGKEALLELGRGTVDLILSDIHMPNLDGLKLLEILNQHDIGTPVVFLTGEPSPDVEARGREMGAADYLRKPIQRDILLGSIERILKGP